MLGGTVSLEAERRRLVRLCAAISGDRQAAEDLAQETLVEAWRNRHKLRDPAAEERWLNAIARNVCLRWARRRGREAVALTDADVEAVAELDVDLERHELEDVLDGALSLLQPETRSLIVQHYVEGSPHAELAARHGLSEDAISMRISRGRVVLHRVLAEKLGQESVDGWRETRVWCSGCGARRLQMLRHETRVAFRCPDCSKQATAAYDLDNPSFAQVIGDRVRPTAILRHAAEWVTAYFGGGTGHASCTRCARPVGLRRHREGNRDGLHGACDACGEEVWSSVQGLALARPEASAFRREHRRVRTLPARDLAYHGTAATLVRLEALRARVGLDVVLSRDTLRVLAVR